MISISFFTEKYSFENNLQIQHSLIYFALERVYLMFEIYTSETYLEIKTSLIYV